MVRAVTKRFAAVRAAVAVLLVGGLLLAGAAPAAAHVSVTPEQARQGGYATVTFQVPNERDDASTVKVEVALPTDTPIASVVPQAVPGWQVAVETTRPAAPVKTDAGQVSEVVAKITWSGGTIPPGQFQAFPVLMGPLPRAATVSFATVQTYSDGDVVRWIEAPLKGAPEPQNPAPVLALVADGDRAAAAASASAERDDDDNDDGDDAVRALAVAGVILGALGVALGAAAFVRSRRAG